MRTRAAFLLAWSLWGATLALCVVAFILGVGAGFGWQDLYYGVLGSSVILLFATVGALVASPQPGNAIGWLFMAFALLQASNIAGTGYAEYAETTSGLPAADVVGWFAGWSWMPSVGLLVTFLFLLFPDGNPPSSRWRWAGWVSGAGILLIVTISAVSLWPLRHDLLSGAPVEEPNGSLVGLVLFLGGFGLVSVGAVASLASLVVRFRRSRGELRQQLKWFTFAGLLAFAGVLSGFLPVDVTEAPLVLGFAAVPVGTGIAILRYRLYDIDRIINRTLVYGALSVLLAGVYAASAIGLGAASRGLSGQSSSLAVAVSTLLVAALFGPARRRIQAFIDRRFYRRQYDSARTVEAFSAKLRDQVDLAALSADLLGAVRETLQPASASLWLAPQLVKKKHLDVSRNDLRTPHP